MIILLVIEEFLFHYIQKKQLFTVKYDAITYLWTRQHFEQEATKLIKHNKNSKFMLVECDIKNFKFINQNYGIKEADKLIRFYSKLLYKATKELHGIIGRGYADHFYILAKIQSSKKTMTTVKKQIDEISKEIKKFEKPFFPKYGIAFLKPGTKNKDITIESLIAQASFAKSTIKYNHLKSFSIL